MKDNTNKAYMYLAFRVLVGVGFLLHGGQKLFGWFGGPGGNGPVELVSLMGLAGIIELLGGLAIALGFYTTIASGLGAIVMLGAWGMVHIPRGINPLVNGGEAAMLYFAAFLVLMAYGAGSYSLERYLMKKEKFH